MENNNHFSVKDSYGMNTLAFMIDKTMEEGQETCSIEKLKCFMEQLEDGFKKTFYFQRELEHNERKELVLLTLKPGEAIINSGEYMNGVLNIGKKPETIKYSAFRITENEADYKEFDYTPNFKRPIAIIDPAIGDELKPVIYFDTKVNHVKAKIKLLPNKSYIALEVRN